MYNDTLSDLTWNVVWDLINAPAEFQYLDQNTVHYIFFITQPGLSAAHQIDEIDDLTDICV